MYGFIGNIGTWELVFIMLVALIVVGPGKLPEVARSVGKALSEFKKTTSGVQKEFQNALKFDEEPKPKVVKPEVIKPSVSEADEADEADEVNESNEPLNKSGTEEIETKNEEEHNPYQ